MAKNAIVYGNGESRKEWDITRKFIFSCTCQSKNQHLFVYAYPDL